MRQSFPEEISAGTGMSDAVIEWVKHCFWWEDNVCVCVQLHAHVCVLVFTYIWRLEADIGYLLWSVLPLFIEAGSSTEFGACQFS